jgi:hypothetical protein
MRLVLAAPYKMCIVFINVFAVHRAYDLAVATCYTFAGTTVKFIEVGLQLEITAYFNMVYDKQIYLFPRFCSGGQNRISQASQYWRHGAIEKPCYLYIRRPNNPVRSYRSNVPDSQAGEVSFVFVFCHSPRLYLLTFLFLFTGRRAM